MEKAKVPVATKCRCDKPQLVQFGLANICMRDDCLTAWVWTQAKRYGPARYHCNLIYSRDPETWLDFLQHFRAFAWQRIVVNKRDGINFYDITDACKHFLVRAKFAEVPTPDTKQYGFDADGGDLSQNDLEHQSEQLIQETTDEIAELGSPFQNALASEVISKAPGNLEGQVAILLLADAIAEHDITPLLGEPYTLAARKMDSIHYDLVQACR